MYEIIVHNNQGASDAHTAATRKDIETWLRGWSDPENLSAVVTDEYHMDVGYKPAGRKTINWITTQTEKDHDSDF
jgi:hypothetical protein